MLEPLGSEPLGMHGNKKSRKAFWIIAIVVLTTLVSTLGTCGTVGGALLFGNKLTDEYKCAMAEVKKNKEVVKLLGEPLEAGLFAPGNYSRKNSQKNVSFQTSLTGSQGSGTLYVRSFSSPLGSNFQMSLVKDGTELTLYNGVYSCG